MNIGELEKNLKARNKKAAAEGRPFEDLFSEYQSEMIRQSIAYAENRAEKYMFILILNAAQVWRDQPSSLKESFIRTMNGIRPYVRGKNHLQFPERKKGIYEGRFCVMRLLSVSCVSSTRGQCRR